VGFIFHTFCHNKLEISDGILSVFTIETNDYVSPLPNLQKNYVSKKYFVSLQLPILVNRGWVPRGWREKNIQDQQDFGETLDVKEADEKTDEKGTWWKFWSKKPEASPEVIYCPNPFFVVCNLLLPLFYNSCCGFSSS
jgi:hypothetical protein